MFQLATDMTDLKLSDVINGNNKRNDNKNNMLIHMELTSFPVREEYVCHNMQLISYVHIDKRYMELESINSKNTKIIC